MKIIHCADLHLDSKMDTNLTDEQARERRSELLETFHNMLEYGKEHGVRAVLISGDLFDKQHIRKSARLQVEKEIADHTEMDFYYLRGNHDNSDFIDDMDKIPFNLKMFKDDEWTTYTYENENIVIAGRELDYNSPEDAATDLVLDQTHVNIVMLHGQTVDHQKETRAYTISLPNFKGRYIDYLALGHIHSYSCDKLDDRGIWCYPGCLEGRGFDECGEKGFVMLDITAGKLTHEFVSLAKRQLHRVEVPVTPEDEMADVIEHIRESLENIPSKDLVSVVITGTKNMNLEIDEDWIMRVFSDKFYYFKVDDEIKVEIDYAGFANDRTLKGTFVRLVQNLDNESEERKARIIETGIKAIMEGSLE